MTGAVRVSTVQKIRIRTFRFDAFNAMLLLRELLLCRTPAIDLRPGAKSLSPHAFNAMPMQSEIHEKQKGPGSL
jgi:hypothetical protein